MSETSRTRGATHLDRQFAHPRGLVGRLIGHAMALEHRTLHREVVRRLQLEPDDRVLEIGFGPGTAIQLAAQQAAHVSGVDISKEMVQQALQRNRAAVRDGRVDLREGSASRLPYPDASFTVVFEVNSLHHWDDQVQGMREVRRVLKSSGSVLLTLREAHGTPLSGEVDAVVRLLRGEGLEVISTETHSFEHGGAFVMARRP